MAVEKIVTLCKEGDSSTQYYPNIKGDNIPSKAILKEQLNDNLQNEIDEKANSSDVYVKTEVDTKLANKVNVSTYNTKISQIENTLDEKAYSSDVYDKTDVDDKLANKKSINVITLSGLSGTLTQEEYNFISSGLITTLLHTNQLFELKEDKTNEYVFNYEIAKQDATNYKRLELDYITINKSSREWTKLTRVIIDAYDKSQIDTLLGTKQDTLVSGTNLKTLNNQSLLGSGNIEISENHLYLHKIYIYDVSEISFIQINILNNSSVEIDSLTLLDNNINNICGIISIIINDEHCFYENITNNSITGFSSVTQSSVSLSYNDIAEIQDTIIPL